MRFYEWWQSGEDRDDYSLTYPERVEFLQVAHFLNSVRQTVGRGTGQLFGVRALVLEVVIDQRGIHHRLMVPSAKAGGILGQLENHIPDVHAERRWAARMRFTHGREYGTTNHSAPLAVEQPEAVSRTILGSVKDLAEGEAAMYQLVLTSAVGRAAPSPKVGGSLTRLVFGVARGLLGSASSDKDVQAKLEQPNFLGVLRTAVRAGSEARAFQLLLNMQDAIGSLHSNRVQFRLLPPYPYLLERIRTAAVPFLFPARFSLGEAAALAAVPLRSPELAGLPRARTRHMRPDSIIPKQGIVLARSTVPGRNRPLALLPTDFMQHLYVPGKTGTGKTTVLENIAAQWITQPQRLGFALFDPHGDLAAKVLDIVPRERLADVIYLDPTDTANPVGLNLLKGANPSLVTSYLMGVLEKLWGAGVLTSHVLRNTIYTVALRGNLTLYEVALALDDPRFRDGLVRGINDEQLQRFWTRYENLSRSEQAQQTEPVMRRLGPLLTPEFRGIFGQAEGIDMRRVLAEGKILVVNLAEGQIGEGPAALLGALIVARLWQEVQGRSRLPEEQRTPYLLIADEFQRFLKLPTSFGDMTSEARKFRLGLVLANQLMDQIRDIRSDVLANTRSKLALETVAADAAMIAREIGVTEDDIKRLGRYEAVLSLVHDNQPAMPATGYTLPPPKPVGLASAAKAASRSQYGKPIEEVEREMRARRDFGKGGKQPPVGEQDWTP